MARRDPAAGPHYPIRAVARMTGLSIDTLRAWERRYEAVVPRRSERGRVYTDGDVTRLRRLGELVERGHAIGTIARLADEDLARLIDRADELNAAPAPAAADGVGTIIGALDRYDLAALESALNAHAVVLPPRELVFGVIVPLLRAIGDRWEAGTLRPAQEHLVSAIVRSVAGGLLRAMTRPRAAASVVFATPSGERHELGLLCAALLAAADGIGVIYLGPDLPADDIWHAAAESSASAVVLGLTTPGAVPRDELRRLSRPPAGIQLWVGGPASPDLLALTGARGRHLDDIEGIAALLGRRTHG
jgi:DNA-binding transcriptional MerR regulator